MMGQKIMKNEEKIEKWWGVTSRGVTSWKTPKNGKNEKMKNEEKIEKMKNWKIKNDKEWLEEELQLERPPKKWGKNWKIMGRKVMINEEKI